MSYVDCKSQGELEKALKNGDWPQLRGDGHFEVREGYVEAFDQVTVRAYDSSTVRASGSSTVHASGSSTVRASKYVGVTIHSNHAKVEGGNQIKLPRLDTPEKWCEFYDVEVKDGVAILFKAVDEKFCSKYGTSYLPGTAPEAPDWDGGRAECGGGLHFSPRPYMAMSFNPEAVNFVACPVSLSEMAVHPDGSYPEKVKAPRVCAPVWQCDVDGNRIEQKAVAA